MKFLHAFAITAVMVMALASCAGHRPYVNREADFGVYQTVAVIPFSNLSAERTASEKVSSSFISELLLARDFQVTGMGDFLKTFRSVIKDERSNWLDGLSRDEAKSMGDSAKVQGIFVGAVKDYGMVRSGQEEFPLVSVTVRFIDCQSGQVVWSSEITEKGGPKFPIFSFGETYTLGEMTAKVCRKLVESFSTSAK